MKCIFEQLIDEVLLLDCNPLSCDEPDVHPTKYSLLQMQHLQINVNFIFKM